MSRPAAASGHRLALLGEVVVPVEFGGKTAGKVTRGHRVLAGDEAIPIGFPDEYEQTLLKAHVVADVEKRRLTISKALDKATRVAGTGLRWREDEALVDTVTHLTEWPNHDLTMCKLGIYAAARLIEQTGVRSVEARREKCISWGHDHCVTRMRWAP